MFLILLILLFIDTIQAGTYFPNTSWNLHTDNTNPSGITVCCYRQQLHI